MSAEQMCRDLLTIAIRDGLVSYPTTTVDKYPQCLTSGELVGMANLLCQFIDQEEVL